MYAVDDLSDAIDATREFLTPVRKGTWLKLALVLVFIGGAGFGNPLSFGDIGDPAQEPTADPAPEVATEEVLMVVVGVLAAIFVLWLLWMAIAAVMEFVFVESLRKSEVHVRRYAGRNLGRAVHLFLFRLALTGATVVLVGVPAAFAFGVGTGTAASDLSVAVLFLLGLLVLGAYLAVSVIGRFTSVFVTAIMLHEERGVLSAWKRFWRTLRSHWKEYVVYLVLIWIIQLAMWIAFWFLSLLSMIVVMIPFVIVALAISALAGEIGAVLGVGVGLFGMLVALLVILLIRVPIRTYYRYYALLVLGDVDPDLDLIATQRARIRGDGGEEDHSGGWDRGPDRDDRRNDDGLDGESTRSWDDDSADSWDDSSEWTWGGADDDRTDDSSDDRQ